MKNIITAGILAATSLEAMAIALVEDDLRLGFSDRDIIMS